MKVLMINGSPRPRGCTYTALTEVANTLHKHGIETELVYLGTKPVAGCIACNYCETNGRCVFEDQVNELSARLDEFDGFIIGSPVYFAGPAGQLCAFLDRLFYCNYHSKKLQGKPAAAVVSCRRGGNTASFDRLNKYFTICNMLVVGSQYWNQVHGNTPEQVMQDVEGLQTMRTLGENMAWLLKSLSVAREQGVSAPELEPVTATNFIR